MQKKTWAGTGRVNREKKKKKVVGTNGNIRDIWFGIFLG